MEEVGEVRVLVEGGGKERERKSAIGREPGCEGVARAGTQALRSEHFMSNYYNNPFYIRFINLPTITKMPIPQISSIN